MELLVGTSNSGKLVEIQAALRDIPLRVLSLIELGSWPKVLEDGATYEENALKKARTLAKYSGYLTLADDSGLEVDALCGAPGIHSSRYCGEEGNDDKNNEKLLAELRKTPEERRNARFVCVLALCAPDPSGIREWTVRAHCEGRVVMNLRGEKGFGYDPLFFYQPLGKTFGEIDRETKALVSHRGKALKQLARILAALVEAEKLA
jgi:XTP/dITP diphosphohydrolase